MRPIGMVLVAASLSSLLFSPAMSEPRPEDANRLFAEARTMCQRDNGRLWGVSLCGPMLLVDHQDRSVLANQPDPRQVLRPAGRWFRGTNPECGQAFREKPPPYTMGCQTPLCRRLPSVPDRLR